MVCLKVHAKVWTVDNNYQSIADSNNIQGILNIASAGDTIVVMPSLAQYGSVTINKKIFIYSHGFASHLHTENKDKLPILSGITINTGVFGVKLIGLVIASNVSLYGGSHVFINNDFQGSIFVNCNDNLFQGNLFSKMTNTVMISIASYKRNLIVNNIFNPLTNGSSYSNNNSFISGGDSSNLISNNLFVEVLYGAGSIGGGGFAFFLNSSAMVQNNIMWSNVPNRRDFDVGNTASVFKNNLTYSAANTPNNLPGFNYNDTMPAFLGGYNNGFLPFYRYENDFRLSSNSVGFAGGTDGQDVGIYGNSYAFDVFGVPYFIGRLNEVSIENANVKSNQKVKVKIKLINNVN